MLNTYIPLPRFAADPKDFFVCSITHFFSRNSKCKFMYEILAIQTTERIILSISKRIINWIALVQNIGTCRISFSPSLHYLILARCGEACPKVNSGTSEHWCFGKWYRPTASDGACTGYGPGVAGNSHCDVRKICPVHCKECRLDSLSPLALTILREPFPAIPTGRRVLGPSSKVQPSGYWTVFTQPPNLELPSRSETDIGVLHDDEIILCAAARPEIPPPRTTTWNGRFISNFGTACFHLCLLC